MVKQAIDSKSIAHPQFAVVHFFQLLDDVVEDGAVSRAQGGSVDTSQNDLLYQIVLVN